METADPTGAARVAALRCPRPPRPPVRRFHRRLQNGSRPPGRARPPPPTLAVSHTSHSPGDDESYTLREEQNPLGWVTFQPLAWVSFRALPAQIAVVGLILSLDYLVALGAGVLGLYRQMQVVYRLTARIVDCGGSVGQIIPLPKWHGVVGVIATCAFLFVVVVLLAFVVLASR
jgi:hypothetical protein